MTDLKKPKESIALDNAVATMETMAGRYGDYPWTLSDSNWGKLRKLASSSGAPDELVRAIQSYNAATASWGEWEQNLMSSRIT